MFGYDSLFDFDGDGRLDDFETAAQYDYIDRMSRKNKKTNSFFDCGEDFDEEEEDVFGDAGLDYDDLECMNPWERREVLEDAGLDPDDFDF